MRKEFKLYNDVLIPEIALGTWQTPSEIATKIVFEALKTGYTHIDTAIAYGNEEAVGLGIKMSGLKREAVFITSKIPAEVKNYGEAKKCIDESLKRLGVEYLDLMLIHAPRPWSEMGDCRNGFYYPENLAVWQALEEAYLAKKVRAIGVSNFQINDLMNILEKGQIKPMVNQICIHIGNTPQALIDFCHNQQIVVEAYSPMATGRMFKNPQVIEMADKYQVSVAQLAIKYCLEIDTIPLPKTTHTEYLAKNLNLNFAISAEDIAFLRSL